MLSRKRRENLGRLPRTSSFASLDSKGRSFPLVLFSFAFLFFIQFEKFFRFPVVQGRDINRALGILQGQWIWHGPDLSGGGATPGPFYYWILGLPLAMTGKWESLVWLEIILASAAAVVFWRVGRTHFSEFAGILYYFFFLLSAAVADLLCNFWNPSYLFLFQALVLLLMIEPSRLTRRKLIAGGLICGFSLQIHYTQAILIFGALGALLCYRENWREKIRKVAIFLGSVLLPILPYLVWTMTQPSRDPTQSTLTGVKTLFDPIGQMFYGIESAQMIARLLKPFGEYYDMILSKEAFFFPVAGVWYYAIVHSAYSEISGKQNSEKSKALFTNSLTLWISFAISSFFIFTICYGPAYSRYMMPFYLLYYAISAPLVVWFEARHRRLFLVWIFLAGLFVTYGFKTTVLMSGSILDSLLSLKTGALIILSVLLVRFLPRGIRRSPVIALLSLAFLVFQLVAHRSEENRLPNWPLDNFARKELAKTIIARTGWSYDVLREVTYFVGKYRETDISVIYDQEFRRTDRKRTQEFNFDGLVVVHRSFARFFVSNDGPLVPRWGALSAFLPSEMLEASGLMGSRKFTCVFTERVGLYDLCYYRFEAGEKKLSWNNLGYPYRYKQPSLFPIEKPQGVKQTRAGRGTFYLNACGNTEAVCTVYFEVELSRGGKIDIRALGDPIGMPDPAWNPTWSVAIKDLSIRATCGNREVERPVATYLGYRMGLDHRPFFLAPYQARVIIPCDNPKKIVVVGPSGLSYFNNSTQVPMVPFQIEWALNQGGA